MEENIIKTKQVLIVDDKGNSRIELKTDGEGNPKIILRDNNGMPSILLDLKDNEPNLTLNASNSMVPGVDLGGLSASMRTISLRQMGKYMGLKIGSTIYGSRILICIGENDEALIELFDEDNNLRTMCTSSHNGQGNVLIIDKEHIISSMV